jgi:hypothetical protein
VSWGGGHIPPSTPFIRSGPFQSSGPNPAWGWGTSMGSGSQSTSMSSTSTPSHFTVGSRVTLSPHPVSAGGNPFPGQFVPWKGPLSSSRGVVGEYPSPRPVESLSRDVTRGKPLSRSVYPHARIFSFPWGSAGGNLGFPLGNQMGGGFPPFNQGPQGFIPSSGSIENSFWKPGASYNPRPSFQAAHQSMTQPRLPFLETLHFPDLSKLMNDPIHHDPSWPAVPTKLPSDIPKFEGKSGEDP